MSSMISETSWLALPSCSAISSRTFAGPVPATCWPADAEGVADLVADPAADLVLEPRGGLEPLDQRAPLEVGEHAVELVGDLLELGQQVLLLARRPRPPSARRAARRASPALALPCQRSSPASVSRGVLLPLLRRRLLAGLVVRRLLRRFPVDDRGTTDGGFGFSPASARTACPCPPARTWPAIIVLVALASRHGHARGLGGLLAAGRRPTASGCPRCP